MAFPKDVIDGVTRIARREGLEPAALLAVVQVESSGKPYNLADPSFPTFLFERHVFYKQLASDPARQNKAVSAGLAHNGWRRSTQYLDQDTSAKRIALLARATAISKEAAYASCSWGVGQIMGFNATSIGFQSAVAMVDFMRAGKLTAQIDCMYRFIKWKKLDRHIRSKNWAGFAQGYNGNGYAANQYDTKMAVAYKQWVRVLTPSDPMQVADMQEDELEPLLMPPVPESMAQSAEGNTALVVAGTGVAGVVGKIVETIGQVPDSLMPILAGIVTKPTFWVFLVIVAAGGYIYYRRYMKWRDAET